jgi:hypothetical protein
VISGTGSRKFSTINTKLITGATPACILTFDWRDWGKSRINLIGRPCSWPGFEQDTF